jgi:uncharacterized protein YfaQ (DUF2300 family)
MLLGKQWMDGFKLIWERFHAKRHLTFLGAGIIYLLITAFLDSQCMASQSYTCIALCSSDVYTTMNDASRSLAV